MDEQNSNLEEDYTKLEELFTKILTPAFREIIKDQTKGVERLLKDQSTSLQSYAEVPIGELQNTVNEHHDTVTKLLVEDHAQNRKQVWFMAILHSIITVIALVLLKFIF